MKNGGQLLNFFKLENSDSDDFINNKGYNTRRICLILFGLSIFAILVSIVTTVITYNLLKGMKNDDNKNENRLNPAAAIAGFETYSQQLNMSMIQKKYTDITNLGDLRSCTKGWESFRKYCYYFGIKKKTWNDAKIDCQTRRGSLVKIENLVENWFIKSIIKEQKFGSVWKGVDDLGREEREFGSIWIGADDLGKEGNMTWVSDKTLVSDGFDDWAPGEPSNGKDNEHCVNMWKDKSYKWNDAKCSGKIRFVCKS